MLLKVGELAKRCGLTVRTLHHYDRIGLLTPSARADNGYRLYGRSDIARLHQILALQRFGLSLAEIGACFAQPGTSLTTILTQQIAMLDQQITQASRLRAQLAGLQGSLLDGVEPELADWLTTLELMTMYDNYFSQDELARLPMLGNGEAAEAQWRALVGQVRGLMESGVAPEHEAPRQLAVQWMSMLVRDTGGDPRLVAKLNLMHEQEPALQTRIGISTALRDYVLRAFSESKMLIYEKYLSAEEARFMRAHYVQTALDWPPLLAEVRDAIDADVAPASPQGIALGRRWLALFQRYAGDSPATQLKFRTAMEQEPELLAGTWADDRMFAFIRQAMAAMMQQQS
ncbi:DNA-binding transcriptional regulator, MerR family [Andreprevotia lacus DSM 23236]|jgi:DNA-binding transcriptional MerR regulator|uniref:DNA-binding transcriptional regulator, MerR family n=1 Tax=Andreprevotia lacus DSM 23236 TaxID=1121001 RepID=A0A1W1XKJ5_9NEIS|nr:MerR family transcriptional regulator [Andreprevotia lacus]SMC24337.1 DNA-binding transcriptional regulator, MerR family [Andreprevotia lacus DSM 23236]